MKILTRYQAIDNTIFDNKQDCIKYEDLFYRVKTIMGNLKPTPTETGCQFENGYGFVQQTKIDFIKTKTLLLLEIKTKINHDLIDQTLAKENANLSWVGRLVSDSNIRCFSDAIYRLQCIDSNFREWGQPYFAINPNESPCLKKLN